MTIYQHPEFTGNGADSEASVGTNVGISIGVNVGTNVGVNETKKKLLASLKANPNLTAQQLSEILGITKRRVESNLKSLKETGYIERVGATKNGHWVVK